MNVGARIDQDAFVREIARVRLNTNLHLARELVADHPGLTLQHALQIVERERKGE